MIDFSVLTFLAWLFVCNFLPGAILSFSIFRKDDFSFLEKLLIGFALGFVILPIIPFLAYFIFGIKYTYTLALISIGLLYAIALAFMVKSKLYEDLKSLKFSPPKLSKEYFLSKDFLIPLCLVTILLVSYLLRIGSYSPVFQELDPYFYTYIPQQILTLGENPFNDQTSWFPEVQVNHRLIPAISYLESIWYSTYTGGGSYNNLLLADIASMYPPIAAVFAVFFVYLLVSSNSKKEWGLVAAALATAIPILIFKLSAGEQEVQPYAFFALAFFYSMYALSIKKKDLRFSVLAGVAFFALALGTSSQILGIISIIIFVALQSIALFLRDENEENLKVLLFSNAIFFIIGPLIASTIIKSPFENGGLSFTIVGAFLAVLALNAVLYFIKQKVKDRNQSIMILGAILFVGLIAYAFTPVGGYIKDVGKAGFQIANFNSPLDRTIAEQGSAPTEFQGQLGFIAQSYDSPPGIDSFGHFIDLLAYLLLLPFSILSNIILSITVSAVNFFLGTNVQYTDKAVSFLLFWVALFIASLIYSLYRFIKKEDDGLFLLFLAIFFPPLVVGIIKAKYTIYAGFFLAVAIGFTFGALSGAIDLGPLNDDRKKKLQIAILLIAAGFVALQFFYNGFPASLVWGSFQTLYQNNPQALAGKFQIFCATSHDSDVCAAANDPIGFANKGTNSQYNSKLCMLSIFSKYEYLNYLYDSDQGNNDLVPRWEAEVATYRCQRIYDYWINSMEWIKTNTEPGARITSWWDYGHWINFFGDRDAVIRNEHASHDMIGAVADAYLDSTPEQLKAWMKAHGSKYALIDLELISAGGSLGGKYGALNYLSCAYNNETTVASDTGQSKCEADHLWENVFVSHDVCTISPLTKKTGLVAYKMYIGGVYQPYYPSFCVNPTNQNTINYCKNVVQGVPTYCVGEGLLANGQKNTVTYYLNETYPNGDLKMNKGILQLPFQIATTYHFGSVTGATIFYTKDKVWLENGEVKDGYEDRKGKFYNSALYQAAFLGSLDGFTLVYTDSNGAVKIYKINDQ